MVKALHIQGQVVVDNELGVVVKHKHRLVVVEEKHRLVVYNELGKVVAGKVQGVLRCISSY